MGNSKPELYIAGERLSSAAVWGGLKITHRQPYGCWAVEYNLALKQYERIPYIQPRALVEVKMGSGVIWSGNHAESDYDTGAMVAVGAVRQGEGTAALTAGGNTTTVPNVALDAAIARGAVTWRRDVDMGTPALVTGDSTSNVNYLTALMDAYASMVGPTARWGVNANRSLYWAADPTVPTINIRADSGVINTTEESLAARVFGAYQSGADGSISVATAGTGTPEACVSLLELGLLSSSAATAVLEQIRTGLQSRVVPTNGLSVTAGQLSTPGGADVSLDQVVAGIMVRALGLRDERGVAAQTDIVLGETIWDVDAGTVQCNPVGVAERTLSGVTESFGGTVL